MPIIIRTITAADAEACANLHICSWQSAFKNIISEQVMQRQTGRERLLAVYQAAAESSVHHGLAAEEDGKMLAMAWYGPSRRSEKREAAELICLHVLPEEKGKGIGHGLMARLLEDMKEEGYEECFLWVFADNERARRFYEKEGFASEGSRKSTLEAEEIMYSRKL